MTDLLSRLEKAVLEKTLAGPLDMLTELRRQSEVCRVVEREMTGCGFFTTLVVPDDFTRTPGLDRTFGDVVGALPDLRNGAGFLIYVKDGVLDMIEGYSYDEPWPSSIDEFRLGYMSGDERDWAALEKALRGPGEETTRQSELDRT